MIKVVCGKCQETTDLLDSKASMEINFNDKKIYFICPSCRKMNEMKLYEDHKDYPSVRRRSR